VGQASVDYRDILEDLEGRLNLDHEYDAIERFMIGVCLSLELSEVGREALVVAANYLEREASDSDLETARVSCWNAIKGRDYDLSDQEVASTRAVICTTFPRGWRDDAFSGLDVFEDFALAAGARSDKLALALKAAFADVLDRSAAQ
jgi:hypothetical protein